MLTIPRILAFLAPLVAVTTGLQAQPGRELQDAAEQFFQAGNYSWRESRESVFDTRKFDNAYGLGVTVIDGFTLATIMEPHNLRAAFYGPRTAFELKDGWRRTLDFTDEEMAYVFGVPVSALEARPAMREAYRKHTHALFHEILRYLMQVAVNFREENGAIVGTITDPGLEIFMNTGQAPRGLLGAIPPHRPAPRLREDCGTFHLWLTRGKISQCVFDFTRAGVIARGDNAGKAYSSLRVYAYEITEIGTTKVDITPDITVVFNDVAISR